MKRLFAVAAAVLISTGTLIASEDWRGNNRLAGTVVDKATGKPVAGAKLKLRVQKGSQGGPDITGDNNGRWAVLGLASGGWNIDVEAPGYELRQIGPVQVTEGARVAPIRVELDAQAAPQPQPAAAEPAHEEVKIGGVSVTPEVAAAVESGNKLMNDGKFKEAVTEYEKAYPVLSSNIGLKFALARAYYGAGERKKAIVLLDEAYKADPANGQTGILLANMLIEDGQAERGKAIIEKLPAGAITDPNTLNNIGIAAMNKKQPAAAVEYFNKAIAMDEKRYEGYYYRGLAYIQMGKAKQAKPDLEKVIAIAPDSPEAKDAREYLKSIK